MEESRNHRVVVTNREQVVVDGVMHVDKFDASEIILETDLGMMALRGEDLHIKQLSLEQGQLLVDGAIRSIDYLDDGGKTARSQGWLKRLFFS
ncbi:MAG: sporulation protein YabP [Firmicutes bacterium]|nr:sporulation protein YabP [Dethiobacter sp.]MBS3889460.1 sporulation protein YabP [Bacillota bacterium]MBS4054828.1 sporulation protein YabP [Thermaerobacter sp.]